MTYLSQTLPADHDPREHSVESTPESSAQAWAVRTLWAELPRRRENMLGMVPFVWRIRTPESVPYPSR